MTEHTYISPPVFVQRAKERYALEGARFRADLAYAGKPEHERPAVNIAARDADAALIAFDVMVEEVYGKALAAEFFTAYNLFRAMRQGHTIDWAAYNDRADTERLIWFMRWCALRQQMQNTTGVDLGLASSHGEELLQEYLWGYEALMEGQE